MTTRLAFGHDDDRRGGPAAKIRENFVVAKTTASIDKDDFDLLAQLVGWWTETGRPHPIQDASAWKDLIAAEFAATHLKQGAHRISVTPTKIGIELVASIRKKSKAVAKRPTPKRAGKASPSSSRATRTKTRDHAEHQASLERLAAIANKPASKFGERPSPHAHQIEAAHRAVKELEQSDRTQIVTPCGTGKTFMSILVSEHLCTRLVLVLVPRRSLVAQTIATWKAYAHPALQPIRALAVCSDDGATLNPSEALDFLRDETTEFRLIVSTYHSSWLPLAAAHTQHRVFDLVICDEAHHLAGISDVGDTDNLFLAIMTASPLVNKRLFMTATRRILHSDKGRSMDDEAIFGRVAWRMSLRKSIRLGLVTDYRLIALTVNSKDALALIHKYEIGTEFTPRQVATHVALAKAIAHFSLAKVITFHDRVDDAERFADPLARGSLPQVRAALGYDEEIFAEHVSGRMPSSLREQILEGIEDASVGFVANARCLTEGIDLPDLNAVAFLGTKRSKIEILQAIGRALRKPKHGNKEFAYVFVPLIIEDNALDTDPLVELLAALREEDEEIGDCVLHFSEAEDLSDSSSRSAGSSGGGGGGSARDVQVLSFDNKMTSRVMDTITLHVDACKLETGSISWHEKYALLREHVLKHKVLPTGVIGGIDWTSWISLQRSAYHRGELLRSRLVLLDELGIQWNPDDEKWERGFIELGKYAEKKIAISSMKSGYTTRSGYALGQWVRTQIRRHRDGLLPADRISRLEAIAGWKWSTWGQIKWETRLAEAKQFCKQHPRGTPAVGTSSSTGIDLREWFMQMRRRRQEGALSEDRERDLASITGWRWE